MQDYFFGANWKMNMSIQEAEIFFEGYNKSTTPNNSNIVFFPTQYSLGYLNQKYRHQYNFGAQNVTFYPKGAYTGEITAELLKQDNIFYTLIGHSERRELFLETDEQIEKKLNNNLKYGIKTVFCIGENITIRENNQHKAFVQNQLKQVLQNINIIDPQDLVIAYEPIWAIGTGKTASTEQIEEMHSFIRQEISQYNIPNNKIAIIYGGSVNNNNAKEILALNNVNGALIGGASLKPESLRTIIESIN